MDSVLVVDDDVSLCRRLARIISKEGFRVHTAFDGQQAIDAFRANDVQIVISDHQMPQKNGIEVMHEVLKLKPGTGFILVTGYGQFEMAIEALNAGAFDYLKKPIDLDYLLETLTHYRQNRLKDGARTLPTVLVVDDDRSIRRLLVRSFESGGYRVLECEDGRSALELIIGHRVDLVVTDLRMRFGSGIQLAQALTRQREDHAVIMMSAYGDEESAIRAMRLGVHAYVQKPFETESLLAVADEAMRALAERRRQRYWRLDDRVRRAIFEFLDAGQAALLCLCDGMLLSELVDSLTAGLEGVDADVIVFNEDLLVHHSSMLDGLTAERPARVDEEFLARLTGAPSHLEQFERVARRVMARERATVEHDQVGSRRILFSRVTVLNEGGQETAGVALIQRNDQAAAGIAQLHGGQ